MDRDDLITLVACLHDDTLTCRVDGTLEDDQGNEHDPDDVAKAVDELQTDLTRLLVWARQAPKRQGNGVTVGPDGKLVDAKTGVPL